MKFMKPAFGEFHKLICNDHKYKILFIIIKFKLYVMAVQVEPFFNMKRSALYTE